MKGYKIAEAYDKVYGNLNVPTTYKDPEGFPLGEEDQPTAVCLLQYGKIGFRTALGADCIAE